MLLIGRECESIGALDARGSKLMLPDEKDVEREDNKRDEEKKKAHDVVFPCIV